MFLNEKKDPAIGPLSDSGSVVLSEPRSIAEGSLLEENNSDFEYIPDPDWDKDLDQTLSFPDRDYIYARGYIPIPRPEGGEVVEAETENVEPPTV